MGGVEKALAAQAVRDGHPLPDRIVNAPSLSEGLQFFLGAFFDLDTERHHGNGLQPIPWSSILRYAEYEHLSSEETEELLFYTRRMDSWNLRRLAREQKSKQNTGKIGKKR